jgi:hypothetical protein
MANITPCDLIVRCLAHKKSNGRWFGICLDFDISAEAGTPEELKVKLIDMITDYVETVFDTDDKNSVAQLIQRRAPLHYWLLFYFMKVAALLNSLKSNFTFDYCLPFRPARDY